MSSRQECGASERGEMRASCISWGLCGDTRPESHVAPPTHKPDDHTEREQFARTSGPPDSGVEEPSLGTGSRQSSPFSTQETLERLQLPEASFSCFLWLLFERCRGGTQDVSGVGLSWNHNWLTPTSCASLPGCHGLSELYFPLPESEDHKALLELLGLLSMDPSRLAISADWLPLFWASWVTTPLREKERSFSHPRHRENSVNQHSKQKEGIDLFPFSHKAEHETGYGFEY